MLAVAGAGGADAGDDHQDDAGGGGGAGGLPQHEQPATAAGTGHRSP